MLNQAFFNYDSLWGMKPARKAAYMMSRVDQSLHKITITLFTDGKRGVNWLREVNLVRAVALKVLWKGKSSGPISRKSCQRTKPLGPLD